MNRVYKFTDEFGEEKVLYDDRAIAAALFVFTRDNEGYWRVLSLQRGKDSLDEPYKWCCPCGYLDANETLKDCALRECKEETGVTPMSQLFPFHIKDTRDENRQNVTVCFYTIEKNGFDFYFSNTESESSETEKVAWIRTDLLDNFSWAFNHEELIREVIEDKICVPWWKKIIINSYRKFILHNNIHIL